VLRPPKVTETERLLPPFRPGYLNRLAKTRQSYDPVRIFSFRDALVIGQGAVITRNGSLVEESCWEFFANQLIPNNLSQSEPGEFTLAHRIDKHIEAPSLLLKRPWWQNFGHWLVDAATLLALLGETNRLSDAQIIIGRHEDPVMRGIVFETLTILAPDCTVVEHRDSEVWLCSELHYVSPVHMAGEYKVPASIQAFRKRFVPPQRTSSVRKRLFLSRPAARRRNLENQDEIVAIAKEFGFQQFDPANYPLSEQARIFASCEAIVGVKGAAFTNLMFSNPPASALLLSPGDWPDLFFWDICSQLGIDYGEIFGAPIDCGFGQGQNPFSIDPEEFRRALATMVGAASLAPQLIGQTISASRPSNSGQTLHELTGEFYQQSLNLIHEAIRPASYLEVGTLNRRHPPTIVMPVHRRRR
jgi:capsular polysaccharide biosynthesis protein